MIIQIASYMLGGYFCRRKEYWVVNLCSVGQRLQTRVGRASVGVCLFFFPLTFLSFYWVSSDPRGYIVQYSVKLLACDNVANMRYF